MGSGLVTSHVTFYKTSIAFQQCSSQGYLFRKSTYGPRFLPLNLFPSLKISCVVYGVARALNNLNDNFYIQSLMLRENSFNMTRGDEDIETRSLKF